MLGPALLLRQNPISAYRMREPEGRPMHAWLVEAIRPRGSDDVQFLDDLQMAHDMAASYFERDLLTRTARWAPQLELIASKFNLEFDVELFKDRLADPAYCYPRSAPMGSATP
jgi:hypothetical protein